MAELLILCLWRGRDAELKAISSKSLWLQKAIFFGWWWWWCKVLNLVFFIKSQNKVIVLPALKILSEFLRMKIKSRSYKEQSLVCTQLDEELIGPLFNPLQLASQS